MNDNHFHSHQHHSHSHSSTSNVKLAFLLNLSFSIIELVGGFLTNSTAIMADAIHDFGDSLSIGLTWYFNRLSKKSRNRIYTYGYKRFSLVGAVISAIVLGVGSIFVLREAIPRLLNPQDINAEGMLILAILGVLVNGIAALRLSHSSSISENIISLHLLEDLLGWISVLIASVIMIFVDLPILDPALSILITSYILLNLYRQVMAIAKVLLQAIPDSIDLNKIENKLISMAEIDSCHDIRAWTMDGQYHILTMHLVLKEDMKLSRLERLKTTVRNLLHHEGIEHYTIEYELEGDRCQFNDRSPGIVIESDRNYGNKAVTALD